MSVEKKIRDLHLPPLVNTALQFGFSLTYAIPPGESKATTGGWDKVSEEAIGRIVKRLENLNDPERQIIRNILDQNNIQSILDAGCGTAMEYKSYRSDNRLNINYVGLDESQRMLTRAKDSTPSLVRGDIHTLPFSENAFDAVLLKHVLEHLHHYEGALREAFRVSRNLLIVDFFHTLLPFNLPILDKKGYWNNWYSRHQFETFLQSLPVNRYERMTTTGNSLQTAEIYVAIK